MDNRVSENIAYTHPNLVAHVYRNAGYAPKVLYLRKLRPFAFKDYTCQHADQKLNITYTHTVQPSIFLTSVWKENSKIISEAARKPP